MPKGVAVATPNILKTSDPDSAVDNHSTTSTSTTPEDPMMLNFLDNSSGDLDNCEVRLSTIKGAGLGLFATKEILPGQRITKYSGRIISHAEAKDSNSSYILYVNKKICLNASGPGHMAGRYSNNGSISNIANNARFGASQRVYTCKITGRKWVSVIATKLISRGDEILSDYGPNVVWTNLHPSNTKPGNGHNPNGSSDDSHSSGAENQSSDGDWSPSTPAPDNGPQSQHHEEDTSNENPAGPSEAIHEDDSEVNTGPTVAEVLDKLWYEKMNQKTDFRAES